ncbi:MAG: hypothetical protein LBQ42_02610 [Synergistaceae bacterium]|nr:hypothetical protein [Synergistaceae bacterium]
MKVSGLKILGTILLAGLLGAPSISAEALYRFDDLYGPSGKGAQWMVVTGDMDTGGSPTAVPMVTTANFVEYRDSVLLMNGGVSSGDIQTLFLVLPETQGTMLVNFDWTPPYPTAASYTQDVLVDNAFYQVIKTPLSVSSGPGKSFSLDFLKSSGSYESVRGNFIFHQNPASTPSQTLQIPFIIANVYNGTAEGNPLLFKTTIRDASVGSSGSGNIVAYDRFDWNVVDDKTVGADNDWVFVPIPKLPIDANTVNYRLSTEVVNYTSIRYALQRYDGYAWAPLSPSRWAFDTPAAGDVPTSIYLDELSHIPPGLVTIYNQSFNVVSGVREAMHMYPVDPASGFRDLTIAHRSIFGLDLGSVKDSANPNSYIVAGFQLLSAGIDFLSKVGSAMGVSNVKMPEPTDGVMSSSVSYAYIAGDVIASLGVDAGVPARMRGNNGSGLLPLHVTFNLPRANQLVSPKWDSLLQEWRGSGNIRNLFSSSFSVYLQDSYGKNLDLTEWLNDVEAHDKTVKVFLDEQRNVLTVSFIVMLMDGAKATARVVNDATTATNNTYVVVMDGNANNRWDMKFFVAPSAYAPTDHTPSGKASSGGGCDATALGAMLLLFCVPIILKRR